MEILNDDALLEKIETSAGITNAIILSDPEREQAKNIIHNAEGLLSSLDREIELLIARRADAAERLSKLRVAVAPQTTPARDPFGNFCTGCGCRVT